MKSAKKRRAIHESDASLLFFEQGELNAEADRAAYERELADAVRPNARRWLMLAVVAAVALIAAIAYVASS